MAVSKETQNKTTGSVGGNAQEQQNFTQTNQAAGQTQGQNAQAQPVFNGGLLAALHRPVGRSLGSEVLTKIVESFRKLLEEAGCKDKFQVQALDANDTKTPVSAVLVTFPFVAGSKRYLAAHTVLIEASAPHLQVRSTTINNVRVEIQSVVGDVYNVVMREVIRKRVGTTGKEQFVDAGASVFAAITDVADKNRVQQTLLNAINALLCMTNVASNGAVEGFYNLANVANTSERFHARVDSMPRLEETICGLPVRSDLQVSLYTQEKTQNQHGVQGTDNYFNPTQRISTVSAYVDLILANPNQNQMSSLWGGGVNMGGAGPLYRARVILSNTRYEVSATTLELHLQGLLSATILGRGGLFKSAFDARHIDGPDLRDIGAIGYEVGAARNPDGTMLLDKIDTKSTNFTPQARAAMLNALIHQDPIFSLLVDESGDSGWLESVYLAAANGTQSANNAILQAADRLFAGKFMPIWNQINAAIPPEQRRIVINTGNRMHVGYYDIDGRRAPLSDIDYLALLNLVGKENLQTAVDWATSFEETISVTPEERTARRYDILKRLLQNNVHITSYAWLLDFSASFIAALIQAAQAVGMVISPETVQQNNSAPLRGTMDYTGRITGLNAGPNVFQQGVSNGSYNPLFSQQLGTWR